MTDRGTILLQTLRNHLQGWAEPIKRATYATRVELVPGTDGEFSIRVTWKDKGSAAERSFEKEFTRKVAFGSTYAGSPLGWRVEKRACDHAREVIQQVLSARGAL